MSQGSLLFPTTGTLSGLALVTALNAALDALVTNATGASAPTNTESGVPEEGQIWINTTTNPRVASIYDGGAWLEFAQYDDSTHIWKPGIGGGADSIASASTTDLGSVAGSYLSVTGTTTITSFGSSARIGEMKVLSFAGVLQLTYNATSMILPGAASITTAAGDIAFVTRLASSNWKVVAYLPATGQAVTAPTGIAFPGSITGLLPSSMAGGSGTATMTVGVGSAADSTGVAILTLASPSSWAVANGNAANGYQGGATLPNSNTIHMFICKGSSGVCTFAAPTLSPTPPSGYNTYYRRIFSFYTNSGGSPTPFVAREIHGGSFYAILSTAVLDMNGVVVPTSRTAYTFSVPTGLQMQWVGRALANGSALLVVTSMDEPDLAPSTSASPLLDIDTSGYFGSRVLLTNTSGQLGMRASTGYTTYAVTIGWVDFRRS